MPPRPQASDGRRPNQGALVVLLSAMAVVNAAVLLLVFGGDRLWGAGDAGSGDAEVAQVQPDRGEITQAPAGSPVDPAGATGQNPGDQAVSEHDPAPHETVDLLGVLPIEPVITDPPALAEAGSEPPPAEDVPVIPTAVDLPRLEFFGIPVLD